MTCIRRALFPLLLALAAVPVTALAKPDCVGLVLGGGGARGAAHIGVLKVLERERVPICAIAGTSMGAVVGSLYSVGYTPEQIEGVLTALDWKDVFNDDPPRAELPMRRKEEELRYLLDFKLGFRDGRLMLPRGVVQGQKLNLLLRRLLLPAWQVTDFDRLPIPFRCVGTDIGRGEGVVFERGDLATAVRASMSVPGAFAPIRVDGRLMVDGGIYNNVPVDVVRAMGATRVIVVDVSGPLLAEDELGSPFSISLQMLTMLMNQRTAEVLRSLQPGDVQIKPELGSIGSADFERAAEAIPLGAAAAESQLASLHALALPLEAYAERRRQQPALSFDPPLVEFVRVLDDRSRTPHYVADRLDGLAGSPLDVERIQRRIGEAYGQGSYERIGWGLVERGGRVGIEVLPVDKGWGPNFITFALQLSDDFEGRSDYSLAAEATISGFNEQGGEWRNRAEIGRVSALRSEFHQPWGERSRWFVEPALYYQALQQPLAIAGSTLAEYRFSEGGIEIETGFALSPQTQFSAALLRGRSDGDLRVGDPELPNSIRSHYGALALRLRRDDLDDADFPSQGSRTALEIETYQTALGSDQRGDLARLVWDRASARGRHHLLLGARLATSRGAPDVFRSINALGGFTNLSGFGERELIGSEAALLRAVYYRRFGDMSRLFSVPAYIGASLESGNVWFDRDDFGRGMIFAGSAFVGLDSPFGPIFFGYGRNEDGSDAVHLTFGSLLRP